MTRDELLNAIDEKYKAIGQDPDVHLSGLLHGKPMTYWDYVLKLNKCLKLFGNINGIQI